MVNVGFIRVFVQQVKNVMLLTMDRHSEILCTSSGKQLSYGWSVTDRGHEVNPQIKGQTAAVCDAKTARRQISQT